MYIFVTSFKKSTFKGLISKKGRINRELWGKEGGGEGGRGEVGEGGFGELVSARGFYKLQRKSPRNVRIAVLKNSRKFPGKFPWW